MNAIETVSRPGPFNLEAQQSMTRWVSFELAGQQYAVAILKVFEVLASADIEPVPTAPRGVIGVINLRGSIVTVMDLRNWLGFTPSERPSCILIVNHENQPVGFCVDRIIEVLNIAKDSIQPVPKSATHEFAPCVSGLVNRNGEILTLLELSDLIKNESNACH
jgi:purine-binding chemotaxis protein CheW